VRYSPARVPITGVHGAPTGPGRAREGSVRRHHAAPPRVAHRRYIRGSHRLTAISGIHLWGRVGSARGRAPELGRSADPWHLASGRDRSRPGSGTADHAAAAVDLRATMFSRARPAPGNVGSRPSAGVHREVHGAD